MGVKARVPRNWHAHAPPPPPGRRARGMPMAAPAPAGEPKGEPARTVDSRVEQEGLP